MPEIVIGLLNVRAPAAVALQRSGARAKAVPPRRAVGANDDCAGAQRELLKVFAPSSASVPVACLGQRSRASADHAAERDRAGATHRERAVACKIASARERQIVGREIGRVAGEGKCVRERARAVDNIDAAFAERDGFRCRTHCCCQARSVPAPSVVVPV